MLSGTTYRYINENGMCIEVQGKEQFLDVDSIIICAGQIEQNELYEPLKQMDKKVHLIGGAFKALELDAKHAINQASRLAALL